MKNDAILLDKIKSRFSGSGIELNTVQAEQFFILYSLLMKYNDEYDLTRLKSFDSIVTKHFIDSAYITLLHEIPSPLVDIGTGAGFPGLPLKILIPGLQVILAEHRQKRVKFMEMAVRELKLEGTEMYPHLVTEKSFFLVRGAVTRALESVDATLERVRHFMPEKGLVLFMKGDNIEEDLSGISPENLGHYSLAEIKKYTLPGTTHRRRLLIYEKTNSSVIKTYRIFLNEKETTGAPVTSPENKKFKSLKKLLSPKGIRGSGMALISGKKILADVIGDGNIVKDDLIIYDGYAEDDTSFMDLAADFHKRGKLLILKKSLYGELDIFNTGMPLLTVLLPEPAPWHFELDDGLTLAVPFQDPANVGAVIRSAAGLSVKKVILLQESANPFHPKSIRASGGAVFNITMEKGPSLQELQKITEKEGISLITLDKNGSDIRDFHFPERFILLPGIEGSGLPDQMKKNSVSLPISSSVESYNAAVAAAIAMYEWRRRKINAP